MIFDQLHDDLVAASARLHQIPEPRRRLPFVGLALPPAALRTV